MIALLQRVNWAQVKIDQQLHSEIGAGLLVFVGIEKTDNKQLADKLLDKILALRMFVDADQKMNLNLQEVSGELMLVSQFTLAANTDKGLRPGFSSAMPPAEAELLYKYLVDAAGTKHATKHAKVANGKFGADMKVALENDGPVTFILRA